MSSLRQEQGSGQEQHPEIGQWESGRHDECLGEHSTAQSTFDVRHELTAQIHHGPGHVGHHGQPGGAVDLAWPAREDIRVGHCGKSAWECFREAGSA